VTDQTDAVGAARALLDPGAPPDGWLRLNWYTWLTMYHSIFERGEGDKATSMPSRWPGAPGSQYHR